MLPDKGFIDLAAGKVEAGQVAIGREACNLDLVGHGPNLALGGFGFQQLGQYGDRRLEGRSSLLSKFIDRLRHPAHLQAAQHDDECARSGIMTHGAPR
jgi:hypothetical protein